MKNLLLSTSVVLAASLAACQSAPPQNADLMAARVLMDRANSDPYVARSGGVELHRAQEAMDRAENAWADHRDTEETRHLSYIAGQRAQIALAVGQQARADERVQRASADRERIRLAARTREAEVATDQARAAQLQAEQAAQSEEATRTQALIATQQADAARAQAAQDADAARAQAAQEAQAADAARAQAAQAAQQTAQAQAMAAQQADDARAMAAKEAERSAALERDLHDLQAKNTDRGTLITLGDVLFDTGRATLHSGAQRTVDKLGKVLQEHPERRVLIEGFTDSTGNQEFNEELSRRRAQTVQEALVRSGIPSDRIEVRGGGPSSPIADNSTPEGRQMNRRVEVLFSDPQGHFGGS